MLKRMKIGLDVDCVLRSFRHFVQNLHHAFVRQFFPFVALLQCVVIAVNGTRCGCAVSQERFHFRLT